MEQNKLFIHIGSKAPEKVGWGMELDGASLIFHLKEMGLHNEAAHFRDLARYPSSEPEEIPCFGCRTIAAPWDLKKDLIRRVVLKRLSEFHGSVLTEEDVYCLDQSFGGEVLAPMSSFNSPKLMNRLGPAKHSLFSEEVLKHFNGVSGLRCRPFLDFVHVLADVQNGLEFLLDVDPSICDSVSFTALEEFIKKYSDGLASLERMQETEDYNWYKEFYVPIIVNRFAFFLGVADTSKFDLRRLISSREFVQFVRMDSMDVSRHPMSIKATTDVYSLYVGMNSNGDGMLAQTDFKTMKIGEEEYAFSPAFVSRIFDVLQTYEGKMDFGLFLSVYFPLRYMDHPAATRFFFEIFDIDEDGIMSILDISYFFKSLVGYVKSTTANFDYYLSEMFDMAQCQSDGITEEMLRECGEQGEIVKMLMDAVTFSDWEREDEPVDEANEE
jgi:Ca2+-binding EF-hand superfamily protein